MSDTMLTIIGAVVGVLATGVLIAIVVFAWKFATKRQASHIDGLAASAASRGWQFAHASQIGKIQRTWSGTTDGLAWTAEHIAISNNSGNQRHRRHTFRWRAPLTDGPASPLVLIHERSSLRGIDEKTKELPGFLQGLASAAIDHVPSVYFGREAADVDLSTWVAVDGHGLPGMRVLAPVVDATARVVCQRIAPSIARTPDALVGGEVPAILIQRSALHLASRSDMSAADVERAVALGAGIGRALS